MNSSLQKFFDLQIQTLAGRGVTNYILEALRAKRNKVINEASGLPFKKGDMPFLPVIPLPLFGLKKSMSMIRIDGVRGKTKLELKDITDKEKAPSDPYYIYKICLGYKNAGNEQKPKKLLKQRIRRPLNLAEVIALCTQTNVLLNHYCILAVGSHYKFSDVILTIIGNSIEGPELLPFHISYCSHNASGIASCANGIF